VTLRNWLIVAIFALLIVLTTWLAFTDFPSIDEGAGDASCGSAIHPSKPTTAHDVFGKPQPLDRESLATYQHSCADNILNVRIVVGVLGAASVLTGLWMISELKTDHDETTPDDTASER
jgi:hypothetical protein